MSDASRLFIEKEVRRKKESIVNKYKKEKNLKGAIQGLKQAILEIKKNHKFITLKGGEEFLQQALVNEVFKDLIKDHSPSQVLSMMRENQISNDYIAPLDAGPLDLTLNAVEHLKQLTEKKELRSAIEFIGNNTPLYEEMQKFHDSKFYGENIAFIKEAENYLKNDKDPSFKALYETYFSPKSEKQVNLPSNLSNALKLEYEKINQGKGDPKKIETLVKQTQNELFNNLILKNDRQLKGLTEHVSKVTIQKKDEMIRKKMEAVPQTPGKTFTPFVTAQSRETKELKREERKLEEKKFKSGEEVKDKAPLKPLTRK